MQIKQPEDFLSRHRTVKHNHLYLVDDFQGNIPDQNSSGLGMYHLDTRFLSTFNIKLHGTDPIPLLSSTEMGYMSTIVFTNGPIETVTTTGKSTLVLPESLQLKRETVLYGLHFERYWLISYHPEPIVLELCFEFGADFKDMFNIRGIFSEDNPVYRLPILDRSGKNPVLVFSHKDRSDRMLQTGIRFVDLIPEFPDFPKEVTDLPPLVRVVYRTKLLPREPFILNYEIQTIINDRLMNAGAIEKSATTLDEALEFLNFRSHTRAGDTAVFTSDNEDFNEMMSRNHKDMSMLMTHTDEGSYVAAGIPWYVALFGRDSLISSRFTLMFTPMIAKESLKILAKYQGKRDDPTRDEENGKIPHELRMGELARLGVIPHTPYYGSVDATPLFIITLYDYFLWTNDQDLLCELWPNAMQAMKWIDRNLTCHPLGYSTYRTMCEQGILQQGWKDSHDSVMDEFGVTGKPPIALSEVQGYIYRAKICMAELAAVMEDAPFQQILLEEARAFRKRFNQDFWMDDLNYCAIALDQEGKPFRVVSSNPGHCLECGIFEEPHAEQVMKRLMEEDMFSDWGIRTLSSLMVAYNPMSYHNGSVWPHDNAMIAKGFSHFKRSDLVARVFNGLFEAARHIQYQRLPELFCGFRKEEGKEGDPPVRYTVACSPQAWSAATMYSLIQSMLGIQPNAQEKRLYIRSPNLPSFMNTLRISNLRVGEARVDLEFRRTNHLVTVDVQNREGKLDILIAL